MARIRWVSRLLRRWFHWRNRVRYRIHSPLDIENTVVDSSRRVNDLINAAGIDFEMMRLEKILIGLDQDLQIAVVAVYGGNEWIGLTRAASVLSINRSTLIRRLCAADRAIAEALEEDKNAH